MQFLILGLLLLEPASLYDLHKRFQAGPSLFYSASFGALQRALRQLAADGLVSVADDPDSPRRRKLHSVTDAGRAAWRSWMHEPVTGSNAETVMLSKIFQLGLLPAAERAAAVGALRAVAAAELAQLEHVAAQLDAQEVPDRFGEIFPYQRATLDYGIRSNRLALTWLDELS